MEFDDESKVSVDKPLLLLFRPGRMGNCRDVIINCFDDLISSDSDLYSKPTAIMMNNPNAVTVTNTGHNKRFNPMKLSGGWSEETVARLERFLR